MGGAFSEALRAYCRAQDWAAADRLLGLSGDRVVDPLGPWGDVLPPAVADHDAWYLLAMARRQVRSGHWDAALDSYRRAEEIATGALVRRTCQRERFQLVGWMDPSATVPHDWTAFCAGRWPVTLWPRSKGSTPPPVPSPPGANWPAGWRPWRPATWPGSRHVLPPKDDDVSRDSVLRRWADAGLLLTARFSGLPYSAAALQPA